MSLSGYRPSQPTSSVQRRNYQVSNRPASTPENRQGATTRRSLRLWRAAIVLICLSAGVGAYLAVSFTNQSVQNIDRASDQIVRLERTKADLLNGQAILVTELAKDSPSPGEEYLDKLGQGAQSMAKAAEMADGGQASFIHRAIEQTPKYLVELGAASQQIAQDRPAGLNQLKAADQRLQTAIITELDAISGSTGEVILEKDKNIWVSLVLLLPILLIVLAGIDHARRTRRLLNLGLVVALLAMGGTWYVVDQALTGTAMMVDQSRAGPQFKVQQSSKALSEAAAARNAQALVALGALPAAEGWQRVDQATEQLREAAKIMANPSLNSAVDGFVNSQQQLVAAVGQGNSNEALQSSDAAARELDEALNQVVTSSVSEMNRYAKEQSSQNEVAELFAIALPILAALAAGFGLSQPLRRYR